MFCYLGDMTAFARSAVNIGNNKNLGTGWSKFRDLLPWLASRGLLLSVNDSLYSGCVHNLTLYGRENWPVKDDHVLRLDVIRNDAGMARWMCNIRC